MVKCPMVCRVLGWRRPLLVGEHRRLGAGLRPPRPPSLDGEHTTIQPMHAGRGRPAALRDESDEGLAGAVEEEVVHGRQAGVVYEEEEEEERRHMKSRSPTGAPASLALPIRTCTAGCLPDSVRESELVAATNAACDVWWRLICSPSLLALVSGKERSS